jgi:outer membrane protein OmpA-like peptidoglycan-associated protein
MTNFANLGKRHFINGLSLSALVLGGAMGATASSAQAPAAGQSAPAATTQPATGAANSGYQDPNDSTTYATGKPLQGQSKEGFWGHMNPFARKKWVSREVDPIKDRENELDQLQAKNANQIKDVDQRATAGINNAMMAANTADAHAADAANKANAAQGTATGAINKTDALNGTVSNLDQYQPVTSAEVKFAAGRTALGPQGKASLDDMASKLSGEKGYIIEIEGFSRSGLQTSQAMADSVARYLVTEHQVPLYRIYRTGMGKPAGAPADGEMAIVNGVRVTLLHNSLATMGPASATNAAPTATPNGNTTAVSNPPVTQ